MGDAVSNSVAHRARLKPYTSRFVFAAGDTVCPILAQLQIGDHVSVSTLIALNLLSRLGIEEGNLARFVTSDDDIWSERECTDDGFRANRVEMVSRL